MMKKKTIRVAIIIFLMCLFVLSTCCSEDEEQYYSEKENYINVTGTIAHIKYNEDGDALYLGFSDLTPTCDDDTFKIVGENLTIVQANGIDEKLSIGNKIEFVTAPRYFGDGYVMPIVSITISGEELLTFEEGYTNFLEWLNS